MRQQRGFTYLSVIILVAIIGLVAATTLKMGSVIQRSRAEEQLLDIGAAFSDALQSYADATPAGMPTQPPSLKELLRDPRFPGVRRHLRQIFVDPMTGKAEWGMVYLGGKTGVVAVYSLSDARPIKIGNFPPRFAGLEGKQKISEWRFTAAKGTDTQSAGAGQALASPFAAPSVEAPSATLSTALQIQQRQQTRNIVADVDAVPERELDVLAPGSSQHEPEDVAQKPTAMQAK